MYQLNSVGLLASPQQTKSPSDQLKCLAKEMEKKGILLSVESAKSRRNRKGVIVDKGVPVQIVEKREPSQPDYSLGKDINSALYSLTNEELASFLLPDRGHVTVDTSLASTGQTQEAPTRELAAHLETAEIDLYFSGAHGKGLLVGGSIRDIDVLVVPRAPLDSVPDKDHLRNLGQKLRSDVAKLIIGKNEGRLSSGAVDELQRKNRDKIVAVELPYNRMNWKPVPVDIVPAFKVKGNETSVFVYNTGGIIETPFSTMYHASGKKQSADGEFTDIQRQLIVLGKFISRIYQVEREDRISSFTLEKYVLEKTAGSVKNIDDQVSDLLQLFNPNFKAVNHATSAVEYIMKECVRTKFFSDYVEAATQREVALFGTTRQTDHLAHQNLSSNFATDDLLVLMLEFAMNASLCHVCLTGGIK